MFYVHVAASTTDCGKYGGNITLQLYILIWRENRVSLGNRREIFFMCTPTLVMRLSIVSIVPFTHELYESKISKKYMKDNWKEVWKIFRWTKSSFLNITFLLQIYVTTFYTIPLLTRLFLPIYTFPFPLDHDLFQVLLIRLTLGNNYKTTVMKYGILAISVMPLDLRPASQSLTY